MKRAFIPTLFDESAFSSLSPLSRILSEWDGDFYKRTEVEIYEDDETFSVEAPMPGVDPEQIKVTLKEGILYLSGERKEKQANVRVHQRFASKYSYQIAIPHPIDEAKVEANVKNGVIIVRLLKAKASRSINIQVKAS